MSGAVQYQAPTGGWSAALVNEPVASGVGLRTGSNGGASLHIAGDRIAIAVGSEVKFLRLDRDVVQIAVSQGRIGVHLTGDERKTVEIDLPSGGTWLTTPGDYDIVAGDAHDPARIETLFGKVAIGGGLKDDNLVAASPDSFDSSWRVADANRASSPLSPLLSGAESLDANGTWASDDTYGQVWYPKGLPADWVPFRYGQWRYLAPWGWTWIDANDWGFAPSHYGGWERIDERWAWVPGPQTDAPPYSPARAAFLGTPGYGLSRPGDSKLGTALAWFPLAADENVRSAHFRNRRAATVVPRAIFVAGQPPTSALLDLPEWRLDDAPVIAGGLGIAPVGDGGSGYIAEIPPPVVTEPRVVSVPLRILPPPTVALAVRLRDMLAHVVQKKPPPTPPHRSRIAAVVRQPHSTHNRPHLAAARGGAQYR